MLPAWVLAIRVVRFYSTRVDAVCGQCISSQKQKQANPSFQVFYDLIKSCIANKAIEQTKTIHSRVLAQGLAGNYALSAKLIVAYGVCRHVEDARKVFAKMPNKPNKNTSVWNAVIRSCVDNFLFEKSLVWFGRMLQRNVPLDRFTLPCALKACAHLQALKQGKAIHSYILRHGFDTHISVHNALIAMYANCDDIAKATHVFENMSHKDLITWNTMITAFVQNGLLHQALLAFGAMQVQGISPNSVTLACVIPACVGVKQVQAMHGYILSFRSEAAVDTRVWNALINMYAKCGFIDIACRVFGAMPSKDIVSWTALISGWVQNGCHEQALQTFKSLKEWPNSVTIVAILPACAARKDLDHGKEVHAYAIRVGLGGRVTIGNAIIDMYAKCKEIELASKAFDKMPIRDVISWNVFVTGLCSNGYHHKALKVFREMGSSGFKPDAATMVSILPACAQIGVLKRGMEIHNYAIRSRCVVDVAVGNSLIDMYSKCGRISIARSVFDRMTQRSVVSWNIMIAGYGMHGYGDNAIEIFHMMKTTRTMPDYVTFLAVLFACSHGGLAEKGLKYFQLMLDDYQMKPRLEHYTCLFDGLGRAGKLEDVNNMLNEMPVIPDLGFWGALLSACKTYGTPEVEQTVSRHLMTLGPKNPDCFTFLSNMYAAWRKHTGIEKVRTMSKERRLVESGQEET